MERGAPHQKVECTPKCERRDRRNYGQLCEFALPRHESPESVQDLECLSQCDKELRRLDARNGVEIVPNVDTYRPHRSGIPQPNTDSIGVFLKKLTYTDWTVNIAAIIKYSRAQTLLNSQWKA